MDELPLPVPQPYRARRPTPEDIVEAMDGVPAGLYRSVDLLPRYLEWARRRGRSTPTSAKDLGEVLRRHFTLSSTVVHGRKTLWEIPASMSDARKTPARDTAVSTAPGCHPAS